MSSSKEEASAIETELLKDYKFGQQQLIEIWGQACAVAITKVCVFLCSVCLRSRCALQVVYLPYEATVPRSPSGETAGSHPLAVLQA